MNTARTYTIRQRILQTAAEYSPAPICIDDLVCSLKMRGVKPTREELVRETNYLTVQGFLEAIPESDGEYARIPPSGCDQAGPVVECARDHRIWGAAGL